MDQFDFAILILSADDSVKSRGETKPSARDNVILELGLCIGKLGRERTFAVCDKVVSLPSDLAGVELTSYASASVSNRRRLSAFLLLNPANRALLVFAPAYRERWFGFRKPGYCTRGLPASTTKEARLDTLPPGLSMSSTTM